MAASKETIWQGYYDSVIAEAADSRCSPADVLDETWWPGEKNALEVMRYIRADTDALEIGCGVGRVSRHVAGRCRSLVCTDILDEALEETRRSLGDNPRVSYQKINGYDLRGFDDETFGVVYSFGTFFHLDFEVVVNYLSEIARVLKVGGNGLIEFKGFENSRDLLLMLKKIEELGIAECEMSLAKFRYVSSDMLSIACSHFGLRVLDDELYRFTFLRQE